MDVHPLNDHWLSLTFITCKPKIWHLYTDDRGGGAMGDIYFEIFFILYGD